MKNYIRIAITIIMLSGFQAHAQNVNLDSLLDVSTKKESLKKIILMQLLQVQN